MVAVVLVVVVVVVIQEAVAPAVGVSEAGGGDDRGGVLVFSGCFLCGFFWVISKEHSADLR